MIVGVPREIKVDEYRVALLPVGAELLGRDGNTVLFERGAGAASGFSDTAYEAAGAKIIDDAAQIFAEAGLIIKVKEPLPQEIAKLGPDQTVFTYFHFAASRELTEGCLGSGITAVAYETLQDPSGRLPLLAPMSEVAGKMSIQEGAKHLERPMGGRGILLGGVAGVEPANVLILGGGVAGSAAARVAAGMGANVIIMDIDLNRLRYLEEVMPANVTTIYSDPHAIERHLMLADLVVGAVLTPGGRAPILISKDSLTRMKNGAVVVDVCIDQGGCMETSRPTTHGEPTYVIEGVVHYCVGNMPGAVARTSTQALCNATLPYARQLARLGGEGFAAQNDGCAAAVNMRDGKIVNKAVSGAFPDLPKA
ncbi:MAG: alanine dehydrogenase [Phycisphaerae bacterium]|nr:alanine dehydrogenase [Phycisphaerae bacterium]